MVFTSAMIPFCVFTIRNFVVSVPVELDEAAVIDGAGPISLFFKIIMPLLKPTMVTCAVYGCVERFPDSVVSVKQEQNVPDDHGSLSVLWKE